MKRTLTSLATLVVAATATAGLLLGAARTASAATAPPWEPDPSSVGGLTFYNSAGHVVTGGSINDAPIAAYIEGSAAVRAGDTKATLFGFLPVSGQKPTAWAGVAVSGSTTYPNASAPGALGTATVPVVTGTSQDDSVANLVASFNKTRTGAYANVYQLRLLTSAAGKGATAKYDSADILVTGSSWSEIYPNAGTPTSVSLSVSKSSVVFGSAVKLTATVKPSTAKGTVSFLDGKKVLKKVTVSGGRATLTTKAIPGGSQKLTASFAPAATSGLAASVSSAHTVRVKAQATKVTAKGSVSGGDKVTVMITVKPTIGGKATILDGSSKIGTTSVRSGKGSFSTTKLKAGTHKLTVKFAASAKADYASSTSKGVSVTVTK